MPMGALFLDRGCELGCLPCSLSCADVQSCNVMSGLHEPSTSRCAYRYLGSIVKHHLAVSVAKGCPAELTCFHTYTVVMSCNYHNA